MSIHGALSQAMVAAYSRQNEHLRADGNGNNDNLVSEHLLSASDTSRAVSNYLDLLEKTLTE